MTPDERDQLRAPFPAEAIGKLPKPYSKDSEKGNCRVCQGYHGLPAAHLDYAGHAAVTDRLLRVDPNWTWAPFTQEEILNLPPGFRDAGLWINLTICGVTRPGFGDAQGKTGPNAVKEAIGDAIRNAGMRFGVGLDLWAKENLLTDNIERGTDEISQAQAELLEAQKAVRAAWELHRPWDLVAMQSEYQAWAKAPLEDSTPALLLKFADVIREGQFMVATPAEPMALTGTVLP